MTYQIWLDEVCLGSYQASCEDEAVEAMYLEAGYGSSREAAKAAGTSVEALRAVLVILAVQDHRASRREIRGPLAEALRRAGRRA